MWGGLGVVLNVECVRELVCTGRTPVVYAGGCDGVLHRGVGRWKRA